MIPTTKLLSTAAATVLIGGSGLLAAGPVMAAPIAPIAPAASVPAMTMGQMTITITDFAYTGTGTITPGSVINVVNNDTEAHTVTADNGAFDVTIAGGETATFNAPAEGGTYEFFCKFHGNMKGSLTVPAGASTPMTPAPTPTPAPAPAPAPANQGMTGTEGMDQMEAVPRGGADTGAEPAADNPSGAIALGGGVLLIALAGGAYAARKRTTTS